MIPVVKIHNIRLRVSKSDFIYPEFVGFGSEIFKIY